jgi:hypothetical protein
MVCDSVFGVLYSLFPALICVLRSFTVIRNTPGKAPKLILGPCDSLKIPTCSETCIKGHRSSACQHTDRPLFEIKKKGRPVTQCEHCRELRKTKQVHVKCSCQTKQQDDQLHPSAGMLSGKKGMSSYVPVTGRTCGLNSDSTNCPRCTYDIRNSCVPQRLAQVRRIPRRTLHLLTPVALRV